MGMDGRNITQDDLLELGDRVLSDLQCVPLLPGSNKTFLSFSLRSNA